jgi:hypothetical protein
VRDHEPLLGQRDVLDDQEVDVDRPRAVPGAAFGPAQLALDPLAGGEQLAGREVGLDGDDCVVEVGLREDLADGLRFVDRRAREYLDSVMCVEGFDGRTQLR